MPVNQDDVIPEPGAKKSTQVPKFEYDARPSELVVAATVIADGSRAGDVLQASTLLLPAATTIVTPALTAFRTAVAPPPLPAGTPKLTRSLAMTGQAALYFLLLAIPLSGWLMSSAKGVQTVWFGVLPLPDVLSRDAALGIVLERVHLTLNYVLLALVIGHVLAALKHHFVDRDGLLRRMTVFAVLLTTALTVVTAHTMEYRAIDARKSRLGFTYKQMGVPMQGRFKNVVGQMGFDSDRLAQSHASLEVDLASIDTGTEADVEVQGKAWFNSTSFPKATFVLKQV